MTSHPSQITLGRNLTIDLVDQAGQFLGLGAIRVGEQIIRSGRRPMFVEIRNPSGIELVHSLIDCAVTKDEARLTLAMSRQEDGIMEFMQERTVLPGEKGVIYSSKGKKVLWAFEDFVLPLESAAIVEDALTKISGKTTQIHAVRHHVYLIQEC